MLLLSAAEDFQCSPIIRGNPRVCYSFRREPDSYTDSFKSDIIYDLHHVSTAVDNELGVILISNQPPSELHLDPRSRSRLNYRSIQFTRYDMDELYAILQDRAEAAFQPDAVTDKTLARIADHVAETGGDCRHAIELLHRTGRNAEREQAEGHDGSSESESECIPEVRMPRFTT
jgi:Cdc6-like AAA superfamily ATPase